MGIGLYLSGLMAIGVQIVGGILTLASLAFYQLDSFAWVWLIIGIVLLVYGSAKRFEFKRNSGIILYHH